MSLMCYSSRSSVITGITPRTQGGAQVFFFELVIHEVARALDDGLVAGVTQRPEPHEHLFAVRGAVVPERLCGVPRRHDSGDERPEGGGNTSVGPDMPEHK